MSIRNWRVVAFGLLFIIAAVQLGCRFPDMLFGGVETPAVQEVHAGGDGWTVQVHKAPDEFFAAVIHRSDAEFMVAPVTLDLPDGWWRVAARHEFAARGLHRVSFHVRSAAVEAVPVKFVVTTVDDRWLADGAFTVDGDGIEVGAAFHYQGPVLFYFFLMDDTIPFIVRDFTVTDVQVKVVSDD